MSLAKLRLLLHFARKRPLALTVQVLKGVLVFAAIPFFIYVTVYNVSHNLGFHNLGANLAFGVFSTGAFIIVAIALVAEWGESLEELTIPYAHQAWSRPYGYFMHALEADRKQPTLF